jgi:hypothetical protein
VGNRDQIWQVFCQYIVPAAAHFVERRRDGHERRGTVPYVLAIYRRDGGHVGLKAIANINLDGHRAIPIS